MMTLLVVAGTVAWAAVAVVLAVHSRGSRLRIRYLEREVSRLKDQLAEVARGRVVR